MPTLHEATSPLELAACQSSATPCNACAKRRGETVTERRVREYGSEPDRGWVPTRLPHETAEPTFGVELETAHTDRDRMALTGAEAAGAAGPRGWWHPQHDGSVSGPEFTSQPGSLAYWRSIRPQVAAFMRTLVHGGLRAHDTRESCSMHVNIGADGFDDAEHLARFIRLATVNPRWSTRLAQRTHEQVRSWANFDRFVDYATCDQLATEYTRYGYARTGHGDAVNLGNSGRIEFRVPRGTLRVDRFYAKLEWVATMVEFTRDPANRVNVGAYVSWLTARRADYPDLLSMMRELTPGRVDPSHVVRNRPTPPVQGAPATRPDTLSASPCTRHYYAGLTDGAYQCMLPAGHSSAHIFPSPIGSRHADSGHEPGENQRCGLCTAHQPADTSAERDRLAGTWPHPQPSSADMCTCGACWGEHNGSLCPNPNATGAERWRGGPVRGWAPVPPVAPEPVIVPDVDLMTGTPDDPSVRCPEDCAQGLCTLVAGHPQAEDVAHSSPAAGAYWQAQWGAQWHWVEPVRWPVTCRANHAGVERARGQGARV